MGVHPPDARPLEAAGDAATLSHANWLGLLLDRDLTHRRDNRLAARLLYARLRQHALIEDVDYRAPRGLDRALFQKRVPARVRQAKLARSSRWKSGPAKG